MLATPEVIAALAHVRTYFPDVTQVFFTCEQKWLYVSDDGEAPLFGGGPVDVSLLEAAVDSLDFFPAAFHYTTPVRDSAEPASFLAALEQAERFICGFEGDDVQEGIDVLLRAVRAALADSRDAIGSAVTADQLLARLNRDLAQLRDAIEEPQVINYSDNVYLEVAPANLHQRVSVCHRELGWVTVNYTGEGLVIDVLNNDGDLVYGLPFEHHELTVLEDA